MMSRAWPGEGALRHSAAVDLEAVGAGKVVVSAEVALCTFSRTITPGASCGRGLESQPRPQSLALAPRSTCGDTGGQG